MSVCLYTCMIYTSEKVTELPVFNLQSCECVDHKIWSEQMVFFFSFCLNKLVTIFNQRDRLICILHAHAHTHTHKLPNVNIYEKNCLSNLSFEWISDISCFVLLDCLMLSVQNTFDFKHFLHARALDALRFLMVMAKIRCSILRLRWGIDCGGRKMRTTQIVMISLNSIDFIENTHKYHPSFAVRW